MPCEIVPLGVDFFKMADMGVVWGLLCLHPNTIKPSYYS